MSDQLYESFCIPDRRYGPVAFWAVNHHLEPDEIRWQVRQMAEQGLAGFFFHPRAGMRTPYLSEKYWDAVSAAVDEAEKVGIEFWLYDEDPYPSGHAGGKVVLDHPEFVARMLMHGEKDVAGNQPVYLSFGGDRLIAVFAVSQDREEIVDITKYTGRARHEWCRELRRTSYYPGLPTPPDFHWRAKAAQGRWTLDWDAPAGKWRIIWFTETHPFGDFPGGGWADLTNPAAVRHFIDLTHEAYFARFANRFGSVIPGVFTDEPKPVGGWGQDFLKRFASLKGYDLRPLLLHLVLDLDARTPQIRADYRRALLQFWVDAFWQPISDWCEAKGIAFTGHASPEEDPLGEISYLVNLVPCLERMQIPGTDLITTKRIGNRQNAIMNLSPRLASSVAHQCGRERVLCECFGLTEWDVTLEEMRWMADWLLVQGVNLINPHAFFFSIDAFRKYEAPGSQFYQASFWRHYHLLADYLTRLCQIFSGGEHVSRIALLRPHRSLLTLLPTQREKAEELRDSFVNIHQWLTENNYEFDQLDESMLQKAEVSEGNIRLASEKYNVLIIPPITAIERASVVLIDRFVATGGRVVWIDAAEVFVIDAGDGVGPRHISASECNGASVERGSSTLTLSDPLPEYILRLPSWSPESMARVQEELELHAPRAIWTGSPQVYSQHRRKEGRDIFFLTNTEETLVRTNVHVRGVRGLEQWNPENKEACPVILNGDSDGADFDWKFEPHGSALFISSDENQVIQEAQEQCEVLVCSIEEWEAQLLHDNVVLLDKWNTRLDDTESGVAEGWFDASQTTDYGTLIIPAPGGKNWPGRFIGEQPACFDAWYANCFWVSEGVRGLRLVWESETIQGDFDLWFNGTHLRDHCRKRVYDAFNIVADIDNLIRPNATNTVVVRVRIRDRNDGLLEPLRVFGKFRLNLDAMQLDPPPTRLHSGSWTEQGLPHYGHDVAYACQFSLDRIGNRVLLDLGEVRDIAEVFVNGTHAGTRAWRPSRFDITRYVRAGENHLRVIVTGNSANYIHGTRKASGLMQPVKIYTAR